MKKILKKKHPLEQKYKNIKIAIEIYSFKKNIIFDIILYRFSKDY